MIVSPLAGPRLWAARAGLLVAAVLSLASAGCGQRACVEWSSQEGVCPTRAEAPTHLGTCTNITSVDSEGTREGNLCCYAVTKQGPLPDCFVDPSSGVGPTPPPDSASTGVSPGFCDQTGSCGDFVNFGCTACAVNSACSQEVFSCGNSGGCANILSCQTQCFEGDLPCLAQCEQKGPDGLTEYQALTHCAYCAACPGDCSVHASECSLSPTGGGGMGGIGGMSGMGGMGGVGGMSGMGGMGGKGGAGGAGGKSAGP